MAYLHNPPTYSLPSSTNGTLPTIRPTTVCTILLQAIDDLYGCECRGCGKDFNSPCGGEQSKAAHCHYVFPSVIPGPYLIENRVVNPMIIPRRVLTSDTKERMNIGIVVSNGAKRVQVTSAANDTLASLYSRRPNSSSLMKLLCAVSKPYYPRQKIVHFQVPANEPMVNSQKSVTNPAFKAIFVPML